LGLGTWHGAGSNPELDRGIDQAIELGGSVNFQLWGGVNSNSNRDRYREKRIRIWNANERITQWYADKNAEFGKRGEVREWIDGMFFNISCYPFVNINEKESGLTLGSEGLPLVALEH
jgi:hypothetical protein